MLQIQLLGRPQLISHNEPVKEISSAKSLALLYYLACRGRSQSRLALGGLLWPDKSDSEARMNLRQALYQLRQVLPDHIQATRQDVLLVQTKNLVVDVHLFEAALKPGLAGDMEQLQTAVDQYQGDFLSGFFLSDAPEFEEWQLMERERLRSLAIQAMHQLAAYYVQKHIVGSGLLVTRRLIDIEPWREESHQLLMRLLAWDGQVSAALAQYEQCRQLLADELGVEPNKETQALFAQIKAHEPADGQTKPLQYRPEEVDERPFPAKLEKQSKLPQVRTYFIGRELELEKMATMLAQPETRLLTVVGPGGMGKTRLALTLVERLLQDSALAHEIFFVSLEEIEADETVPAADQISLVIARAMHLSLTTGEDSPSHHLLTVLSQKKLLLVLDNFEHLLAGAGWVGLLLQHAPDVKVVVTSQERLNLYEERVLMLRGLALPEMDETEDTAVAADAVQLFIHAAQRVRHDFQPLAEERQALVQLCRFLNGMPLALELSASWVDTLSVTDILAELQQDLDLLATDLLDVAARQRSIRQVFAYAWQRLSDEERRVLAALSVFHGGCTRLAAQQVALEQLSSAAAMRLLADLVQKSLLYFDRTRNRYEMHSLLRKFLGEKLAQDEAEETAVYQRHSDFYCDYLAKQQTAFYGSQQQMALQETEADIENIRLAWQWAAAHGHTARISNALTSLFHFYDIRSWFREGERVFRETAVLLTQDTSCQGQITRAQLQARQGWFAFHLGQHQEGFTLLQQSLTQLEHLDANSESIFNYNYLGAVLRHQGKYEQANTALFRALELAQSLADRYQASISYNILGQTVYLQGDNELARHYCREGLRLKRDMGDLRGQTYSLTYLGHIAEALGNYDEAQQLFHESMKIYEAVGDQRGVALALRNLGDLLLSQTHSQDAVQMFEQSLKIFRQIGNLQGESLCLIRLGEAQAAKGALLAATEFIRQGGQIALNMNSQPGLEAAIRAIAGVWQQSGEEERSQAALTFLQKHNLDSDEQIHRLQEGRDKAVVLSGTELEDADAFVRDFLFA